MEIVGDERNMDDAWPFTIRLVSNDIFTKGLHGLLL
jgi:hypothetical protein